MVKHLSRESTYMWGVELLLFFFGRSKRDFNLVPLQFHLLFFIISAKVTPENFQGQFLCPSVSTVFSGIEDICAWY